MQYLPTLFSGIIGSIFGSIVGGIVTWLVTKNSLKKQCENQNELVKSQQEYQNKLMILKQRMQEKVALKSVQSELFYNIIYLKDCNRLRDQNVLNVAIMLKMNKWEKHSDTIENIENLEYIARLQGFYMTMSAEIKYQVTDLKRTEQLINLADGLSKSLGDTIKTYE